MTLTPTSQVVGQDTTLQVNVTAFHIIPKKGKIAIEVTEFWNQGAMNNLDYYFSSVLCSNLTIGGKKLLSEYRCVF